MLVLFYYSIPCASLRGTKQSLRRTFRSIMFIGRNPAALISPHYALLLISKFRDCFVPRNDAVFTISLNMYQNESSCTALYNLLPF